MDEPGKLRKHYSDSTMTVELKNNEKVVLKSTAEDASKYLTTCRQTSRGHSFK